MWPEFNFGNDGNVLVMFMFDHVVCSRFYKSSKINVLLCTTLFMFPKELSPILPRVDLIVLIERNFSLDISQLFLGFQNRLYTFVHKDLWC